MCSFLKDLQTEVTIIMGIACGLPPQACPYVTHEILIKTL